MSAGGISMQHLTALGEAQGGTGNVAEQQQQQGEINHKRTNSEPSNMETARQLFEEQLEFLDKEKAKLLQDLPPLAPVASSEDLSSSDAEQQGAKDESEGGKKRRKEALSLGTSQEEYALDLACPPIFARLPQPGKAKPKKSVGARAPSRNFLNEWRQRARGQ